MHRMSERPIVTFSRDGQVFELGRSGQSRILHMYGSTGLGLAPVSFASSDRLTGDGSVVRGTRYGTRDVFIPLRIEAESMGALSLLRRDLNSLLAPHRGMVDVRIEDPATGTDRMIRGYLKDGLDGDFGTEYNGHWQKLGLTFECPDPWWLGPEKGTTLRLEPGSKPFLSEGKISRRNILPNPLGSGATNVDYWDTKRGELSLDEVDGEPAGRFTHVESTGQAYILAAPRFRFPVGSTVRFSAEVRVGTDMDMRLHIRGYRGAPDALGEPHVQTSADGWVRYETTLQTEGIPDEAYWLAAVWPPSTVPGDQFWVRRAIVEVDTTGDYFDGNSLGCKWVGGAQGPESIMWDPSATTPFFPVVLAQSAVVGEFTVNIGGEGPVYPAWEIHGPGEDLRIVRGTDRIAIDGVLRAGESILIDTATGRIVPDRWEDVSLDTTLFPLVPGAQTVTVTMVGATTDTQVRLTYRERHLEGY